MTRKSFIRQGWIIDLRQKELPKEFACIKGLSRRNQQPSWKGLPKHLVQSFGGAKVQRQLCLPTVRRQYAWFAKKTLKHICALVDQRPMTTKTLRAKPSRWATNWDHLRHNEGRGQKVALLMNLWVQIQI